MKRVLLMFLGSVVLIAGYSQERKIDPVTNAISYEEVVTADSLSAIEILKLSKKWAVTVFGAGKDMIDYYDESESMLILKPVATVLTVLKFPSVFISIGESQMTYTFYHKFEVETKKGRFRIVAGNFFGTSKSSATGLYTPVQEKVPASTILFYNEDDLWAGAKVGYPNNTKKQKQFVELQIEHRLELQHKFDLEIRGEFESLKKYIQTRPKKDW